MGPGEVLLLGAAGLAAGGVNALAGGGTLFSFPALIAVGLPPVTASASNMVAVWPGHAAAVPPYLGRLRRVERIGWRSAIAVAGGLVGALLLLATGNRVLEALVPWLILAATLLFALGPRLRAALPPLGGRAASAVEFGFAVYGGYFGAGLGVLLLASLALLGHDDPQEANALKNWLATLVTTVAIAVFVSAGAVAWGPTLVVLSGALAGGFFGARAAERLPARWLRRGVVAVGAVLTVVFFARTYAG